MIVIEDLCVAAGEFRLDNVSLCVPTGEYAVLMGRTGCGKTTLLEAVCGLKRVESGRIMIGDRDVSRLRPGDRGIGYVPQDGALFTTMTVRDNLAFGLRGPGRGKREASKEAEAMAEELGIGPLLNRRPSGLSGGERQRVALGRALIVRPEVLCLDEPLSALDDDTREEICVLIGELRSTHSFTALHITHSRTEAGRLGTRVFELDRNGIGRADEVD